LLEAPSRTLLNLNVPNLSLHQIKGVRRGRVSTAGIVKAAGPTAGGEPLADEGELPLRLGAASPELGDVSDEDADEDGALLAPGTPRSRRCAGPRRHRPALDALIHAALAAIDRHLETF